MFESFTILDISQPVSGTTACFPGDVPFSKNVTLTHADSGILNLTAFTMSPHVGTHADAPLHIGGEMENPASPWNTIGAMPLSPFIGPVTVLDVSPWNTLIGSQFAWYLREMPAERVPKRILFKTTTTIRPDVFEEKYASFSPQLVDFLGERGVQLIGIDTPSVDPVNSKTLESHHLLLKHKMAWLENLDLTQVEAGDYFLVALPLKLMELEASPVRAVLLKPEK